MRILFLILCCFWPLSYLYSLPLKTPLLDAEKRPQAQVWIYIDYVEVYSLDQTLIGKIGVVNVQGKLELFLIKPDGEKVLVGWGAHKKLYDYTGVLRGYYDWTEFWAYAYSETGKKIGQAKCIAFRGLCATAIAAYLSGLFDLQPAPAKSEEQAIEAPERTLPFQESIQGSGGVVID